VDKKTILYICNSIMFFTLFLSMYISNILNSIKVLKVAGIQQGGVLADPLYNARDVYISAIFGPLGIVYISILIILLLSLLLVFKKNYSSSLTFYGSIIGLVAVIPLFLYSIVSLLFRNYFTEGDPGYGIALVLLLLSPIINLLFIVSLVMIAIGIFKSIVRNKNN